MVGHILSEQASNQRSKIIKTPTQTFEKNPAKYFDNVLKSNQKRCKVCGETLQEHENNSNNNNNIENANENGILLDLSDSSDDSVILGKNIASIENSNHQFNLNLHQDFQ